MASRTGRTGRGREFDRARAEAAAQAIIAQSRQMADSTAPHRGSFPAGGGVMEEEPMNRYIHPIPPTGSCATPHTCDVQDYLGRILESMACQNQLLIDILGAINALTAATLNAHSRQ